MRSTPSGSRARASRWLIIFVGMVLALASACAPQLLDPPRLATETTAGGAAAAVPNETIEIAAPTPTASPVTLGPGASATATNPTVTLWVNKTSAQYEAALQEMIDRFGEEHAIHVELITIAPDMLPDLVSSAAVSSTLPLPDVVVFPMEYAVGWAEEGILDTDAADSVVSALGPETFVDDALELVDVDGKPAAIPSDGWQQLLLYRRDWLSENDLAPPTTFQHMLTATEVISDRANLIYSFNMPTESSLRATSRTFEQIAIANGCQLIDQKGELQLLNPECREALEFYRFLCNTYCPPGVQTEVSALNAYIGGRSGIIFASPAVLPAIAGLDPDYRLSCPECTDTGYLAQNTGIVTQLQGYSEAIAPQNLGEVSYLGITSVAEREEAEAFARFWFEEGYLDWLAVEPERKVPMRTGTEDDRDRFIEAWYELPLAEDGRTLADIFGDDTAEQLAANLVNTERWGYAQGAGGLITKIYEDLTMSILLQELLSGYYDSDRAAIEGYKRLVDLIPDYAYYIDPEPTPEE